MTDTERKKKEVLALISKLADKDSQLVSLVGRVIEHKLTQMAAFALDEIFEREAKKNQSGDEFLAATKWLSFCAMTSGGTAGPDVGLIEAIERANKAIAALEASHE